MNRCQYCNEPIHGNYCSNCGQPEKLEKIDGHYFLQEIGNFFLINKEMLYTVKNVLINPGESVKRFIAKDRHRFVKPITFLLATSLIYTLANHFFNIGAEDYYDQTEQIEGSVLSLIFHWMLIEYPGYTDIITRFIIAFWIRIFFRKSNYNLFEIFILLCFITGITTLFLSIFIIIQGITHLKLIQISMYFLAIYLVWAIGSFYDRKKVTSYIKALLSVIAGTLMFGILIQIVAILIDFVIK